LRRIGYTTSQLGAKPWIDAEHANMQLAFDFIGGARKINWVEALLPTSISAAFADDTFFAYLVLERLSDRWLHILGIRTMVNHYEIIMGRTPPPLLLNDAERVRVAKEHIQKLPRPFFMHVHLMGTHCCKYLTDYDDAIHQSDEYFGEIVDTLERSQLLDNTLIVYSSDHGQMWSALSKVPLIFRFPNGERKGALAGNVQLVDVMPTVLEYLKQPIPAWAEGQSLLSNRLDAAQRPIFAFSEFKGEAESSSPIHIAGVKPVVAGLSVIICDQWFNWIRAEGIIQRGRVNNYRGACPTDRFISDEEAARMLRQHLYERGMVEEAN
jgi:hypothetical protein